MELNAYILFEHLKRKYPVEMYGKPDSKMSLKNPEFYIDHTLRFHADHVYLATVEHLPQRPIIEKNVVLVCIGEHSRLSYYKEHSTVILLRKKVDFFEVYKSLQDIYARFYKWESKLLELLMNSPTIQDLLQCSYHVFECPLYVLNSDFQYIASVLPPDTKYKNIHWATSKEILDSQDFLTFLKQQELRMDTHGSFSMEFEDINVLCVNLFDSGENYIGCLCMDRSAHPCINGEEKLAEHLARIIEKTTESSPLLFNNEFNSLKKTLQNTLNELPLSPSQRLLLKFSRYTENYICVSVHCLKRFSALPVSYICSVMESLFADSIFFEQNDTILGLIPVRYFSEESLISLEIANVITSMLEEMQLCVGVSNVFPDLYMLRTYYFQAEAAIDNGQIYDPGQTLYIFSDYALSEMVMNSFGGFPIEAYFASGFRKLLKHDQESDVSYLETLSAFLEENMSYAKAAQRLFIHRSTLIERMTRIEQMLSVNLKDPDERLLLRIILKALSIEAKMKNQ